jgi:primosomal protein N' (replication factor Y) (superfamily II helicase)
VTHAERELAEREALRFPPAVRIAAVTGSPGAVAAFLDEAALPAEAELIGPVPLGEDKVQGLIRIPRSGGLALATALRAAMAARTARKQAGQIRIQLDPAELI